MNNNKPRDIVHVPSTVDKLTCELLVLGSLLKKKMDKSFQAVVNVFKPIAQITHKQQVMRLYRKYEYILNHSIEFKLLKISSNILRLLDA